jgi:hypothetical protein
MPPLDLNCGNILKKPTQWNAIGIISLIAGLGSGMTIFYGRSVMVIGDFSVQFGSPFVIMLSITFSFMCFIIGLVSGLFEDRLN